MDKNIPLKKALYPDKTFAAISIILKDVKRIAKIGNILLQLILIAYYTYSVIINIHSGPLFVLKCIMLGLVVAGFVIDRIFAYRKKKNKALKKALRKTLKWLKYAVRIATLVITTIQLVSQKPTDLEIVCTIIAIASIVIQIGIEIVVRIVQRYFKMIKMAVEMDVADINKTKLATIVDKMSNVTASAWNLIDKPLAAIAQKGEEKIEEQPETIDESKKEQKMRTLIVQQAEQSNVIREEKHQLKKEERKQAKKEKIKQAKQRVRDHWNKIWRKKSHKKATTNTEETE